jgi:DNA-directed RNA polymerase specialized sigma24 family protein
MPAKGWRKQVKPLEGPLREEIEQWLDNGGYEELKLIVIPEFGRSEAATEFVHEIVASAMYPSSWAKFDRTKRKGDAIGDQMRTIMWRRLINYRRDNYDKPQPYSLTDHEGMDYAIPDRSYTRLGAHIDLERAVESLEQPYRDIFTMMAGGGYTAEEVAYKKVMDVYDVEDKYDAARLILWKQLKAYAHSDSQQECDSRLGG